MNREDRLVLDWLDRLGPPIGGRLPSERALAEILGVSRAALRKGLATLEAQGLLVRQVGRGTFVQRQIGSMGSSITGSGSVDMVGIDASPRQVLVARLALEPMLARMAARDANRSQFDGICAAEDEGVAAADWATFDAADEAFHRSIATASGNPILIRLFDEVMASVRRVAWGALRRRDASGPAPDDPALTDHTAIRAAILDRDAATAGEAMRRHLLAGYALLVEELV